MTTNPTADSRQSRHGRVYASRSGDNLYLKVGDEPGAVRHLFDLTTRDGRDMADVLADVLPQAGEDVR